MNPSLRIGQVAKATGLTVDAIRFYERQGLLKRPTRTEAGFRLFQRQDIQTLLFIRRAQELGFSLGDIRQLLYVAATEAPACSHVRDLLQRKLEAVQGKLSELRKLERRLKAALQKCHEELAGDSQCVDRHCPVLEQLQEVSER